MNSIVLSATTLSARYANDSGTLKSQGLNSVQASKSVRPGLRFPVLIAGAG